MSGGSSKYSEGGSCSINRREKVNSCYEPRSFQGLINSTVRLSPWCIFRTFINPTRHWATVVMHISLQKVCFISKSSMVYIHIYSLQQVAFLVWTIYGEQGLFEGAAHKSLFNNFQDYSALFSPNFTILHFLALLNNFHHNSSLFSTIQYKFHYFALPGTLKQISALFSTIQYKFHYLEFPSTFQQL